MDNVFEHVVNEQFGLTIFLPVVFVVVAAILVFVFGFKRPDEPSFKQLRSIDSKKLKKKDKKTSSVKVNGHISTDDVTSKKQTLSKKPPNTQKKSEPSKVSGNKVSTLDKNRKDTKSKQSSSKTNGRDVGKDQTKNKKNVIKANDFDDSQWQTVLSKTDKKRKLDKDSSSMSTKKASNEKNSVTKNSVGLKEDNKTAKHRTPRKLKKKEKTN